MDHAADIEDDQEEYVKSNANDRKNESITTPQPRGSRAQISGDIKQINAPEK